MFDSIGWGEVLVAALAALFIFGPERLPSVAKDAARALARIRAAVDDIRTNVDETLGDDLAPLRDLDLRRYHPQTFVRDHILGDSEVGDLPLPGRVAADPGGTAEVRGIAEFPNS
jgi:sec-independent protein translocase protein TatB